MATPQIEGVRFLQGLRNDGSIAAGATSVAFEDGDGTAVTMAQLHGKYGQNFNTLTVLNTDADASVDLLLDGAFVQTIQSSNGAFTIESRDGIIYNTIAFKNIDSANTVADNALRILVGRTGV